MSEDVEHFETFSQAAGNDTFKDICDVQAAGNDTFEDISDVDVDIENVENIF